ncbi:MAG: OmpA family protein [Desulfobacterota bacterium]|jgi:chemotaxis protein MotB|nr:OmpA family protein [Thermodesulfobacteriota bacterium]
MGKRRRNIEEPTGGDGGMTLTVSLFLILLVFFILLCSIAIIDQARVRLAIGSLVGSFGSFHAGMSPLGGKKSMMPPSAPITEENPDLRLLTKDLESLGQGAVKIEMRENKHMVTIPEVLLFEADTPTLKASSLPLLQALAKHVKAGTYPVDIIGHTDNRSAEEKGYRSTWELSGLMALRVLAYFEQQGGIGQERLTAYGSGSERPLRPNDTRASRAENRRIQIVLHSNLQSAINRIYREKPAGFLDYKRFTFEVF